MKNLLLSISCLLASITSAHAINDSIPAPAVVQLAKVVKLKSKAKFWIVYKSPADLFSLEKEGYTILKTKVKMVRNNDFWLDIWQSSMEMAVGYIIAKGSDKPQEILLPTANQKLDGNKFIYKQY